jgi:hypothetical protein
MLTPEEKEKLEEELEQVENRGLGYQLEYQDCNDRASEIRCILRGNRLKTLSNLEVTDEHRKILSRLNFKQRHRVTWQGMYDIRLEDYKSPFGIRNSSNKEIARILNWELKDNKLSNEQWRRSDELLEELPHALNKILKELC